MKKSPKKLRLAKETLLNLESESLDKAFGGYTIRTIDATQCATNCNSACVTDCTACA